MRRVLWSLSCLVAVGCARAPVDAPAPTPAAVESHAVIRLDEATQLTEPGGFLDPAWSPDGATVSFTGERFTGLYAVDAAGSPVQTVSSEVSAFRHRWDGERIVVPRRGSRSAVEVLPASGQVREIDAAPGPVFELHRGDIYLGEVADETRLTQGEDKFFDPVISPDGGKVAIVGLATGIHVLDLHSGLALAHAGPGTHPAWTPDGRWVLFERTGDDGHDRVSGDLWAVRPDTGETVQLTATADAIEVHPSVSPDGQRIAYSRDDAIWVAELVEGGAP